MFEGKLSRYGSAPPTAADRSLLSHVTLFRGLTPAELIAIEQACRYRRFSPDEFIIDRGHCSSDVFFIVRGRVRIVNYSLTGREVVFEDLDEGNYFGELSAIDGQPRSASVVALTDTLIVALPGKMFLDLALACPQVALRIMRRLASRIRNANDRIMDLSTLGANSRVHAEVLRQAQRHPVNGNMAIIDPIPVHTDIASRAGTTRETVARVLNDLARQGIVQRTRTALVVRDLRRLDEMVQEVRG
jgi:CRP-like cAMP-binding protein